ncbi:MAG: hypothetical protein KGI89_03365 [Euryarchaeota archaeon]|nr:hypothetical protein [Euryarchaeota archaeon]
MRPGLVMAGGVFVALGLLVVGVGLINFPSTSKITQTGGVPSTSISPNGHLVESVGLSTQGVAITSGWISVNLASSAQVQVYFLKATGSCANVDLADPGASGPCVLVNVSATTNGHGGYSAIFTANPATQYPYVLDVLNLGSAAALVDAGYTVTANTSSGIPLWEVTIVLVAAGALSVVGGILAFLGFFLRGNPYTGKTMPEVLPEPEEEKGEEELENGTQDPGKSSAGTQLPPDEERDQEGSEVPAPSEVE